MGNMKLPILMFTVHLLWWKSCQCAPTWKDTTNLGENLKGLSVVGEQYVDEEVKKALIGIKQMKIMMERNEVKHKELMQTLKKSSKEKQEALQLMNEVKERLEEEERKCQVSLTGLWNECKSCLESSCMRFYTTCQLSWSSVINKIESFFKKMPQLIFPFYEDEGKALPITGKAIEEDALLNQMEGTFSQLAVDVNTLFNRSTDVFKQIHKEFDQDFQTYFISDADTTEPYFLPAFSETIPPNINLLKSWEIPNFFQLLFDFSKSALSGIGEMITEMLKGMKDLPEQVKEPNKGGMFSEIFPGHNRVPCKELSQNLSSCFDFHKRCQKCQENLLQDCPDVPELHMKFDEAFKLVNISEQQYAQIFQMTQHHMEDMIWMMGKMREKFGWVTELSHWIIEPKNIFSIIKLDPRTAEGKSANPNDTLLEVTILTSPTFIIKVSQDENIDNSNFIEYVVGKALQYYKQHF